MESLQYEVRATYMCAQARATKHLSTLANRRFEYLKEAARECHRMHLISSSQLDFYTGANTYANEAKHVHYTVPMATPGVSPGWTPYISSKDFIGIMPLSDDEQYWAEHQQHEGIKPWRWVSDTRYRKGGYYVEDGSEFWSFSFFLSVILFRFVFF